MKYLYNDKKIINFIQPEIQKIYNQGYLLTRIKKGCVIRTRSLRVDLKNFDLSSENRRILGKNSELSLQLHKLPFYNYSWEIHKLGKEFYTKKFGNNPMSASKIKSMFLNPEKENMNNVLVYSINNAVIGYCLVYLDEKIMHYAYPFYNLNKFSSGIGMMLKAIIYSKKNNLDYVYLGSVTTKAAKYKLQFKGLEWWDVENSEWSTNLNKLKSTLDS